MRIRGPSNLRSAVGTSSVSPDSVVAVRWRGGCTSPSKMRIRGTWLAVATAAATCACGHDNDGTATPDADMTSADAAETDAPSVSCLDIGETPVEVGTAPTGDDFAFAVTAKSTSDTRWDEASNEALVLEVRGSSRGVIGHLILHQGIRTFGYTMHLGALAAGEKVTINVSPLSAQLAVRQATACDATLTPAAALGANAEGMINAPSFRWPVQKAFDDVPLVLGWSKARKAYQTVFSNENGGTVEQCGGGASGIQAEVARWGRAADIEGSYRYGAAPTWERCDGSVATTTTPVRMETTHPILYYGDGHNRVFESRGGYGTTCGSAAPEKPNGDLAGWNVQNPGNELAKDDGRVIILRPLPVDMDALGYAQFGGRREALIDRYAPWLYRLTNRELSREGRIDNTKSLTMSRYLYADIRVSDVGGSGDEFCATLGVSSGFKLRVVTSNNTVISSPQITADYASNGAHDWKRVAIALPAGITAADVDHFVFDAYDNDGIYVTAIGDVFIPVADDPNGVKLDYVRMGTKALAYYVDDGSSGCTNGTNSSGPSGTAYPCVGGQVNIAK